MYKISHCRDKTILRHNGISFICQGPEAHFQYLNIIITF